MSIRLLTGDCRETLSTQPTASVQTVITSPPYYGLRDYGTLPLVWGGIEHEHEWTAQEWFRYGGASGHKHHGAFQEAGEENTARLRSQRWHTDHTCSCGAWLGSLGLEPTPDLYVEHLVEVFRHVRRVLRDDGVLWLNLGDSYAGSGKGPSNSLQSEASQLSKQTTNNGSLHSVNTGLVPSGLKPKDLMMMPFRVAMALQADGWYMRSVIPWLKRNSMPESVTDRPATAVEYVFLLSKSARYFWDADSVRVPAVALDQQHPSYRPNSVAISENGRKEYHAKNETSMRNYNTAGRNRRNSDWFIESWQGLLLDDDGDPLALVVNPAGYSGSHFATFPVKLVEPMIKASTSEKGQCPECGAPWTRMVERVDQGWDGSRYGWRPSCSHAAERQIRCGVCNGTGWIGDPPSDDEINAGPFDLVVRSQHTAGIRCTECGSTGRIIVRDAPEPVPQVILDPFGGAGTVGLVADRLQRNAILCELKPEYADMESARITNDAPMFADVEGGRDAPPTGKVTDKQGASGLRRYTGFNARWDAKKKEA
jgi:DNA modification methylase